MLLYSFCNNDLISLNLRFDGQKYTFPQNRRNIDAIFSFSKKKNYQSKNINPMKKYMCLLLLLLASTIYGCKMKDKTEYNEFDEQYNEEKQKNDMDRINKVKKEYFCEFNERIPGFSDYTLCGVILADVWTETKRKVRIKESFERGDFLETFLPPIGEEHFHNGSCYICGFDGITDYQWVNDNYFLVSMIWEVL